MTVLYSELHSCSICFDTFYIDQLLRDLPCKHIFCSNCIYNFSFQLIDSTVAFIDQYLIRYACLFPSCKTNIIQYQFIKASGCKYMCKLYLSILSGIFEIFFQATANCCKNLNFAHNLEMILWILIGYVDASISLGFELHRIIPYVNNGVDVNISLKIPNPQFILPLTSEVTNNRMSLSVNINYN